MEKVSFLIIRKDAPVENYVREGAEEFNDFSKKIDILNKLKINYSSIDLDNYRFFSEEKLYNDNKMYKDYMDAIFEVYFPSKYDEKTKKNLYYPEEKIINEDPITTYVYKWNQVKLIPHIKYAHYLAEDKASPTQQVLITISE